MLKDPLSDKVIAEIIKLCSTEDLDLLQEILNNPKPFTLHETNKTTAHLIHSFKEMVSWIKWENNGSHQEEPTHGSITYKEIVNQMSETFNLSRAQGGIPEKELGLSVIFFKMASVDFSEQNISTAQKKLLKFKPDMLASNYCDLMRDHLKGRKSIAGLVMLLTGVGVETIVDRFKKISFREITTLAFIAKCHFVRSRI
ncbi:hypothetical protein KW849_09650 [Pseudomonas sp. PDM26]|uniref:hypothetical protein n=1 Tax=Pseudomonas sp. PDM26 TaxID=2854766 RepID=UPI001C44F569|nr:hypothetical protein [Pseudomonas sp. PDM26]MBV7546554.1 hypothetical protein [Pseudomonas sp. PDM26]